MVDIHDTLSVPSAAGDGRPIVVFHTHFERLDDGWSIASRAYARAMDMGGIDVRFASWTGREPDPEVMPEIQKFLRPPGNWNLHLFSSTLGNAVQMKPVLELLRDQPGSGKRAFQSVFERQYVEPDLAKLLDSLDGVWVQCEANQRVLEKAGVRNVKLIQFPWFDDDPHLKLEPPKEHKRFYWIGRFEPRKAPDNLIKAFMRAFKPGEAHLTLKLSPYRFPNYVSPNEVMLTELLDQKEGLHPVDNKWSRKTMSENISIVTGRLSAAEMVELHASNDVYVSASRGEGLDLPAYAAKLSGRTLLLTDSGGPMDFMTEGDVLVPQRGTVRADPAYKWGPGACYSDYDVGELTEAFRQVREGKPSGVRVPSSFHVNVAAQKFKGWVDGFVQ